MSTRRTTRGPSPKGGDGLRRRAAALAILASVFARPALGFAQDEPAPLELELKREDEQLLAHFDVTSAFTEDFRKRLSRGLTSRVFLEMALLDANQTTIVTTLRSCELRVDTWAEVVIVRIQDGARVKRRNIVLIDEALRECGRVEGLVVADMALLTRSFGYRLEVTISLNPVSPELLERTREFTSNPKGTGSGAKAFFGAVARLFRSGAGAGGESFLFRSPPFGRPPPGGAP